MLYNVYGIKEMIFRTQLLFFTVVAPLVLKDALQRLQARSPHTCHENDTCTVARGYFSYMPVNH